MKICMINWEYYNKCGGAGIVTNQLGLELAKLNHEVHIIVLSHDARRIRNSTPNFYIHELSINVPSNSNNNGTLFIFRKLFTQLIYVFQLYSEIHTISPQIIHSQTSDPALSCFLYKIFHNIPYCICFHSSPDLYVAKSLPPRLKKYWRYFPYIRGTALLMTISQQLKPVLTETFGREVCVIPNGADTNTFQPSFSSKSDIKEKPTFICVSRMVHDKGLEDAITAMTEVVVHYPNSELILVGDGILRPELEKQVTALSLQNNVTFTGFIPNAEVVAYYQKAHIFLLPSWNEGFPIVLFEAMGCGLPIVSTCVGSIPDVLTERNGYIVPIKQPHEIALALCKIISLSPQEYEKIFLENIAVAKQNSWGAIAKCYENEYQKVLHPNFES